MRTSTKTLAFPLAGVSRRGPHRQNGRTPFTAPWAVNVRSGSSGERRQRGGSRPGLAKLSETNLGAAVTALIPITYVDNNGARQRDLVFVANNALGVAQGGSISAPTAELEGPDGVDILEDNNLTIDFAATVATATLEGTVRGGRVFLADDVLRTYNPNTGVVEPVLASSGTVPTGQPLVALYRDRIFLAGATQAYYASRVGNPSDWNFGAAIEDPGAAVAGQVSVAGRMGEVVTALIPLSDQWLVIATENTLWLLQGDPTTGLLRNVSDEIGIVSPRAWAMTPDNLLVFLANDGLYVWRAGSGAAPEKFSAERVPDELREVDPAVHTVSMVYDPTWVGFHLFVTPASPQVGTHWWIDLDSRALWPQRFWVTHQPLAAATLTTTGLGVAVVGGRDGYLRYFLDGQADDDGRTLASHLLLGPIHLAENDATDALLAEIHGAVEELSEDNKVTWRVVMGRSPAEAAEAAYADVQDMLDGLVPSRSAASGEWITEGLSRVQRPRSRGPWVVVWLSSSGTWSYEAVTLVARQLGRHR